MNLHPLKIGKLELKSNILIAPLAGYTNLASRLIYRKRGSAICYCEMVSVMGLKYNYEKSVKLIETNSEDRPLGVQLFGGNRDAFLHSFNLIKNYDFDIIDINCGCSVKKVLNAESGAYLLRDPGEIYKIITSLKENTDKPVTLKIRSGWDSARLNYLEVLDAAVQAKADLITFHPRTRAMLFTGKADWEKIRIMKEKSSIPVIGNGDIFSGDDALNMIKLTGCDGIMLARGLIENPFLAEEVKCRLENMHYDKPDCNERMPAMLEHLQLFVKYLGDKQGIMNFRKFIRGYVKGMNEASKLRQKLNHVTEITAFKKTVSDYIEYINDHGKERS